MLQPAARAREIAGQAVEFFRGALFEHHLDEERELFPAVLASAAKGDEADPARLMTQRLTREHRELEAAWKRLESGLKKVAKGQASEENAAEIEQLVKHDRAHAAFEEQEFLPLAADPGAQRQPQGGAGPVAALVAHAAAAEGLLSPGQASPVRQTAAAVPTPLAPP